MTALFLLLNMHMQLNAMSPGGRAARWPRAAGESAPLLLAVMRGAVSVGWRNREVRVDEDAYLLLGSSEPCVVCCSGDEPAQLLSAALPSASAGALDVAENLRPMDGGVGRRLRALGEALLGGVQGRADDEAQRDLLAEVIAEDVAWQRRTAGIDAVKPATREALLRRILLAADFILSHHEDALSLDDMARAASLSRFHFVRLFSLVHGEKPHAFLLRKRTAVARRHLAVGGDAREAAARAGFGSRTTLFRNLRKPAPGGDAFFDEGSAACCRSA